MFGDECSQLNCSGLFVSADIKADSLAFEDFNFNSDLVDALDEAWLCCAESLCF